jgi:ectoine hydroxylase-related dioxygenase (phytanoyl-CoA dioxygenase family)
VKVAFDLEQHARRIDEDGFTIIPDFLDASDLAEARRVLRLYLGSFEGRNEFEGHRTERVYTLVARGRVFWRIVLDARILALCARYLEPGFLLTASQGIEIGPGETPQPFHFDDAFYSIPRPRPMVSLSTIVAIDPFTSRNGGTQVIRGSHRWGEGRIASGAGDVDREGGEIDAALEPEAVTVEMPAGGCVVFSGALVHRGGANHSSAPRLAFSNQYCQPWARQQENFFLGVPTALARAMPERLRELLGYSIHPPFMGQLTASHPAKALDPDYRNRVEAQARAVGARLPE